MWVLLKPLEFCRIFFKIIYIYLHTSCHVKDFCWSLDTCVILVGPVMIRLFKPGTIYTMKAYKYNSASAAEYVIYLGILTTIAWGSAEKNVKHLISWNVWFHVFWGNKSWAFQMIKRTLQHILYTVCTFHQHLQLVTCTCEEGSAWDPWSRSTEGVRGTVCAPPTSAWAPEMWRGRSSRLWKASKWWRRTQMGEREGYFV